MAGERAVERGIFRPRAFSSFNLSGAVLTALLLTSLAAVFSGLVQRAAPAWQPAYLIGACLLVALEAAVVQYTLRRERMWLTEALTFLAAEVMVLLALMRVAATLSMGLQTLRDDLRLWLQSPLAIFDPIYLTFIGVGLVVGITARNIAHDLADLAPQPFEQPTGDDLHSRVEEQMAYVERDIILRRLNARFIWGGVGLLAAMSLQVVNIERIWGPAASLPPATVAAGLIYLICGFLLHSQARLALLRSRWLREGAEVDPAVLRRWSRASLLLVIAIALGALLLPRTYGLGLFATVGALLNWIFGLVHLIFFGISYALIWLIGLLVALPALLMAWLGLRGDSEAPPPALPELPELPPPAASGEPPLLPSLIFWVCVLFLAGYAFWTVMQRHPATQQALASLRAGLVGRLFARLGWFWRRAQGVSRQMTQALGARLRRPARAERSGWPALRLTKLAPRDLVRYFYRSTLQRAMQRGLGRRANQTPYEYGAALAETLPDARDDIAVLTDTFVAAAYSPHEPTRADADRARLPWRRLRRRLRGSQAEQPEQE